MTLNKGDLVLLNPLPARPSDPPDYGIVVRETIEGAFDVFWFNDNRVLWIEPQDVTVIQPALTNP